MARRIVEATPVVALSYEGRERPRWVALTLEGVADEGGVLLELRRIVLVAEVAFTVEGFGDVRKFGLVVVHVHLEVV